MAAAIKERGGSFLENPTNTLIAYEKALDMTNATLAALGQPPRQNMFKSIVESTSTREEVRSNKGLDTQSEVVAKAQGGLTAAPTVAKTVSIGADAGAEDAMRNAPLVGAAQGTVAKTAAGGEATAQSIKSKQAATDKLANAATVGEATGAEDVAKAKTRLDAILSAESPSERETLSQLLGGAVQTDGFLRAMQNWEIETDPVKKDMWLKRINKFTENTGLNIQMKDGKLVSITQGGDGQSIVSGLKARDQLKVLRVLRGLKGDMSFTDSVIKHAQESPSSFGIAGTIKRGVQGLSQGTTELVQSLPGMGGVINGIKAELQALGVPKVISSFDEKLSSLDLLENALAFRIARLRMERSGGDIRALSSVMKAAKNDIKLTGATTQASVVARLKHAKQLFQAEHDALLESVNAQPQQESGGEQDRPAGNNIPQGFEFSRMEGGKTVIKNAEGKEFIQQ